MNLTHTFLLATRPPNTMSFSAALTTNSAYLNGPGGHTGDGFPLPRRGYLVALYLWDGTTLRFDDDEIAFQSGDRISVYCQTTGSNFTVKVRLNGNTTALQITGVPFNTTLSATVEFLLIRE
jgi:hypothetical protein